MSTKLRHFVSVALLTASCCGISFSALGQQTPADRPEMGPPEPSQSDRGQSSMDQSDQMDTSTPAPDDGMSASQRGPTQPVTAQTFASQAATIGKAEIELGQLAMQNGKDASIKQYGQKMVKDHTAADAKLKSIAAKDNLTLPSDLDAEHKAVKQRLSSLKGEEFDAAYRAEMAKGHDTAVALFESASQTNTLPDDLRQFAASTLPTLQQHQDMAHSLGEGETPDR